VSRRDPKPAKIVDLLGTIPVGDYDARRAEYDRQIGASRVLADWHGQRARLALKVAAGFLALSVAIQVAHLIVIVAR
jgi:hypothetical protein